MPKSSARHPLPSGIRTRKSGHYSTSPSFWQSPVLCPGVAWFNSGYSPCVSSQRPWFSSSFSTCWTRILRSFLYLDILQLTPGIWQPLVRCLLCLGYTEKLDLLREDFSHFFLRAPCIWQSLYCVWCCIWSIGLWIFREMTHEWFPYSTLLGLTVDTLVSVYVAFWKNFPRIPTQCLVQLWIQVYASDYGGWFFWLRCTSRCIPSLTSGP